MHRNRWLKWLLVVALLIVASWHELQQIHRVFDDARPTRDYTIYEINVRLALAGKQWFGPYSQWFHHPGPAYFYWLALPYVAAGRTTFSLYAGGQILTLIFVLGTAFALCRWAKSNAPIVLFVPMAALEMAYLGDFPLFDFWPPYVLFFGYALFLVLCAGVAAAHFAALTPMLAVGSLLVQTHVSYVPAVAAGSALAVAYAIRGPSASTTPRRRHVAPAVAILVVLWTPPLYAELLGGKHNFGRLYHVFFETRSQHWTLSAIIDRVALEFSGPFQFLLFRDRFILPDAPKHYGVARFVAILELGAIALASWRSRRRRDRFSEALCLLCLISVAIAAWSVGKIRGEIAPHHTAWISIIGFVGALGAASGPSSAPSSAPPSTRMFGMAAAWSAFVFLFPIRIIEGIHTNADIATLTNSIVDRLRRERITRPRITWGGTGDHAKTVAEYDWATAVMFDLEKRGVPFFIEKSPDLRWMIGAPRWEGSPTPDPAVVRFSVGTDAEAGDKITCLDRGPNYFMRYPICVWLRERTEGVPVAR